MSLQYVIDGYNIIHHPLFIRAYNRSHTGNQRSALLEYIRLERLTGSRKNKLTVVFDGYPSGSEKQVYDGCVNVVFSRKISADEMIKRIVEETADRKNMVVVSDDKEIRIVVRALGAKIEAVEEFSGKKKKLSQANGFSKDDLTYSEKAMIERELRKRWLGE